MARTDMEFLGSPPPLKLLTKDRIWIPMGSNHFGLNDRFQMAPRHLAEPAMDIWPDMLQGGFMDFALSRGIHNPETIFLAHNQFRNVAVGRFSNIGALVTCPKWVGKSEFIGSCWNVDR